MASPRHQRHRQASKANNTGCSYIGIRQIRDHFKTLNRSFQQGRTGRDLVIGTGSTLFELSNPFSIAIAQENRQTIRIAKSLQPPNQSALEPFWGPFITDSMQEIEQVPKFGCPRVGSKYGQS